MNKNTYYIVGGLAVLGIVIYIAASKATNAINTASSNVENQVANGIQSGADGVGSQVESTVSSWLDWINPFSVYSPGAGN